jgi:hypothetical protein
VLERLGLNALEPLMPHRDAGLRDRVEDRPLPKQSHRSREESPFVARSVKALLIDGRYEL